MFERQRNHETRVLRRKGRYLVSRLDVDNHRNQRSRPRDLDPGVKAGEVVQGSLERIAMTRVETRGGLVGCKQSCDQTVIQLGIENTVAISD